MIQDKKGFQINLALYALIAVSVLVISTGVIVDQWNTDYDSGLTYDLEDDFNKLDDVSSTAESQRSNISVRSSSTKDIDFEGTSIRSVFGIVNTIYTPFKVVFGNGGMIDALTDRWGMPDYARQALVTAIIIAITFAIVNIFFGRRKT